MIDPTRAEVGDIILWPGRGVYAVRTVHDGAGGRTYDLDALEGQEDEFGALAWKCRKLETPLRAFVVKARRRSRARSRRGPLDP